MSIEYEITFNYTDEDELSSYLKGLPYFYKYDENNYSFIFRKNTLINIWENQILNRR